MNRRRIQIECQDECKDAEMRLCVDENIDATCDRMRPDDITSAILSNVTVDGRPAENVDLVLENGKTIGIRLGNMAPGTVVVVDTDYKLSDDFRPLTKEKISLRIEVFQTQIDSTSGT